MVKTKEGEKEGLGLGSDGRFLFLSQIMRTTGRSRVKEQGEYEEDD